MGGKRKLKKLLLSILIFLMATQTACAFGPKDKLKRGTINFLSGWIEIPRNIYDKTVEESILQGLTAGTMSGFGMAVVRTGTGLYEIITFPLNIPNGYEPILEPTYVLQLGE